MSYATAKARLIRIVEDVLPTDNRIVGEGCRFVHLPEGRPGIACTSRSFWLTALEEGAGGITGPFTPNLQGQPRERYPLTLTVSYRLVENRDGLDVLMAADLRAICAALLSPANWVRPDSGIHSVTTSDGVFLPSARVVSPESIEQRTSLVLWFN